MNPAMIAGAIRTAIAVASGALVGGGFLDQDSASQASGHVETILGAVGALGTLVWSLWAKMQGGK
jgi:hypothetical protein